LVRPILFLSELFSGAASQSVFAVHFAGDKVGLLTSVLTRTVAANQCESGK
jgi:hypothetical protein